MIEWLGMIFYGEIHGDIIIESTFKHTINRTYAVRMILDSRNHGTTQYLFLHFHFGSLRHMSGLYRSCNYFDNHRMMDRSLLLLLCLFTFSFFFPKETSTN